MTRSERASQIWAVLAWAAKNRQIYQQGTSLWIFVWSVFRGDNE